MCHSAKRNDTGDLVGGRGGSPDGSGGGHGTAAGRSGQGRRGSDTHFLSNYVGRAGSGEY